MLKQEYILGDINCAVRFPADLVYGLCSPLSPKCRWSHIIQWFSDAHVINNSWLLLGKVAQ